MPHSSQSTQTQNRGFSQLKSALCHKSEDNRLIKHINYLPRGSLWFTQNNKPKKEAWFFKDFLDCHMCFGNSWPKGQKTQEENCLNFLLKGVWGSLWRENHRKWTLGNVYVFKNRKKREHTKDNDSSRGKEVRGCLSSYKRSKRNDKLWFWII